MISTFDYTPGEASAWRIDAKCAGVRGPNMFPNELYRPAVEEAKSFCESCPVRLECLAEALNNNEKYGIWGGMDAWERGQLRKKGGVK